MVLMISVEGLPQNAVGKGYQYSVGNRLPTLFQLNQMLFPSIGLSVERAPHEGVVCDEDRGSVYCSIHLNLGQEYAQKIPGFPHPLVSGPSTIPWVT